PGGFAIPMDDALRRVVEVLLRGEEVEYGFLGISSDGRQVPREGGVPIDHVVRASPAQQAGLEKGDVILKVNGRPIRVQDDLFLQLAVSLAGRRAELAVRGSNGAERTVYATLVKAPVGDIDHNTGRPKFEFGVATNRPAAVYGLRVDYTSIVRTE